MCNKDVTFTILINRLMRTFPIITNPNLRQ